MNFGPKVGPLVAELLSGVTALLLIYFDLHGFSFEQLDKLSSAAIVVLVLLAWILGTFFDLVRNLLEHVWDSRFFATHELNWRFFFRGDEKLLANLEHYFWSFYILDADMAVAIAITVFLGPCILLLKTGGERVRSDMPWAIWIVLLVVAILFANDARLLRREIKDLLNEVQ
jgi:hypothetical protein